MITGTSVCTYLQDAFGQMLGDEIRPHSPPTRTIETLSPSALLRSCADYFFPSLHFNKYEEIISQHKGFVKNFSQIFSLNLRIWEFSTKKIAENIAISAKITKALSLFSFLLYYKVGLERRIKVRR
jgi:hypothetical protein